MRLQKPLGVARFGYCWLWEQFEGYPFKNSCAIIRHLLACSWFETLHGLFPALCSLLCLHNCTFIMRTVYPHLRTFFIFIFTDADKHCSYLFVLFISEQSILILDYWRSSQIHYCTSMYKCIKTKCGVHESSTLFSNTNIISSTAFGAFCAKP